MGEVSGIFSPDLWEAALTENIGVFLPPPVRQDRWSFAT
jgi:hypothetical protein